MSFMKRIEAAQRSPLDQLAVDYCYIEKSPGTLQGEMGQPSLDFCRRVLGVPEDDAKVARRLNVKVSKVRDWRERGRRSTPGSCR